LNHSTPDRPAHGDLPRAVSVGKSDKEGSL
jgi:hypothetical protein